MGVSTSWDIRGVFTEYSWDIRMYREYIGTYGVRSGFFDNLVERQ